MNPDDLKQLIRMAQVLRVRINLLADEIGAKHGPQAGILRIASDEAHQVESRLARVSNHLMFGDE